MEHVPFFQTVQIETGKFNVLSHGDCLHLILISFFNQSPTGLFFLLRTTTHLFFSLFFGVFRVGILFS